MVRRRGENIKYFLSLEKGNKSKSCIRRLINDDSIEITDQADIRKEIKTFYENMYTKQSMKTEQECFEYVAKISTPQLSENDKAICKGKLTLQNIWEALNSMKNGKNTWKSWSNQGILCLLFRRDGVTTFKISQSFLCCL